MLFDKLIIDAAISRLALVSVYAGHTSSITSDNFWIELLYELIILLNKPRFSLFCAN